MARFFVWVTSFVAAIGLIVASSENARAWHGCHSYGRGGPVIRGGYGIGSGFHHARWGGNYCGTSFSLGCAPIRTCYATPFYSYSPRCLSYGTGFYSSFYSCVPSYFAACSYYPPIYSSYYCSPIAYRPIVLPTIVYPRPRFSPVIYQVPRVPICASKPAAIPQGVSTPSIASPNASWLTSAVELIDLMVEQGGVEEGLLACEQLIRVREGLPGEIYWRAAALAALSGRDSHQIVVLLDNAEKAGDHFRPRQLPGGSLRAYLRKANIATLDESLNRIAKAALTNADPSSDYRVLSALFALDSQPERARLFLAAASKATPVSEDASLASLAALER